MLRRCSEFVYTISGPCLGNAFTKLRPYVDHGWTMFGRCSGNAWSLCGLFLDHVIKKRMLVQQIKSKFNSWRKELLPEFVFDEACERNIFYGIFDVA